MLNVVVNAYAMCPGMGSEPGMAWNWITYLAHHCQCHVITETEFRPKIEAALASLPQGKNVHLYWNDIGDDHIRKMCWNQGNWLFYYYYRRWQKETAAIARAICQDLHVDVLHQLNMIGFREPGYLWRLSEEFNIPFVWGPIGGVKTFPLAYASDADWRFRLFAHVKNLINRWQFSHNHRVRSAIGQASLLISAIPESQRAISQVYGLDSVIIPETGCWPITQEEQSQVTKKDDDGKLNIIWVGKFDYRKRLDLAIRAMASLSKETDAELHIYGTGNPSQVESAANLIEELNLKSIVHLEGSQGNEVVKQAMREAHLFLFTSVDEDTSTVVMEALSQHLPVLCFDTCGMAEVIDESVGWKIALTSINDSICQIAGTIDYISSHRVELQQKSDCCEIRANRYSWSKKAEIVAGLYESLLR